VTNHEERFPAFQSLPVAEWLSRCPDPERASHNLESFLARNPDHASRLSGHLDQALQLFSYSQFLANFATHNPEALLASISDLRRPFEATELLDELTGALSGCPSREEGMKVVRTFRKRHFLTLTLRDILKLTDFQQVMHDLSTLAEAVLSASVNFLEPFLHERYGEPEGNDLSVIALGKLGALELNYSSDVDLIVAYHHEGQTAGISSVPGVVRNRITAFEYYCKLVEDLTRFLASQTADGFAYRVDLRLRPQGQRGSLALSLRAYEDYYESWGQLWERSALLRARPVAGNPDLGEEFLRIIGPFVYRKYLDYDAIDEIRRRKAQVEQLKSGTFGNDIKRGFGGIREIEFFIQTFQLMYAGREPLLRERGTLKALHRLLQKGLIGYEDLHQLSENYLFLRAVEHRLQQLNDLQTHTLPHGRQDLDILARKMGFGSGEPFIAELRARRLKVREIYDSLLQARDRARRDESREPSGGLLSSGFWDMETPLESLLSAELLRRGVKDPRKAIHCLAKIRNTIYSFQTIRGRRLLENILPQFVEEALKGDNPDHALAQLVSFASLLASKESYLEVVDQRPELIHRLNRFFSHSAYLSKTLMSSPFYLESVMEDELRTRSGASLTSELKILVEKNGESAAIRLLRRLKELRLGMLFVNRQLDVIGLTKALSRVADVIISSSLGRIAGQLTNEAPVAVVAFGKLGGREIIFNSDLDVVFVTSREPSPQDVRTAEQLLKSLMSYTKEGVAYKVDTRLRPEGSKGPLVNSVAGLEAYYAKNAQPWELQALVKARPIAGDTSAARLFMEVRRRVLTQRGGEVTRADVKAMRERISRELSKDAPRNGTYDVKLGRGCLEELEFSVQYLQLTRCRAEPALLVQATLDAVKRLGKAGIIGEADAARLRETYLLYRSVETILRLREESVLKEGSETLLQCASYLGLDPGDFTGVFKDMREWVSTFWSAL